MQRLKVIFLAVGIAVGFFQNKNLSAATNSNQFELLGRYYFTGGANLIANTNAAKLKKIWSLPESGPFGAQILQKFSRLAANFIAPQKNDRNQAASLMEPLLNDLVRNESRAELRRSAQATEFLLGIKLSEDRARLWQTNLWKLCSEFSGAAPIGVKEKESWRLKKKQSPLEFHFEQNGPWILFGWGENPVYRADFLAQIKMKPSLQASKTNWLEAWIDGPRLQKWLPSLPFKLAQTDIFVSGKADNLRTTIRAIYPEALQWKSEPWRIPTNLVRDPLISFTAAQNLAPFLKESKVFERIGINPFTNQIYFWAQSGIPFQSFLALPVKNSTATFKMLSSRLPAVFNDYLKKNKSGEIILATNENEIVWRGLPIVVPYLKTNHDAVGEFLVGGLFPSPPNKNPPPQELLSQIVGRTNLVYYDWEITQDRLGHWQVLTDMIPFLSNRQKLENKSEEMRTQQRRQELISQKWALAVAPLVANTITEAVLKSPTELNILRKSPLGFTGVEIILFARWLNQLD
ncbi:MAG: hypothetical protein M3Y82_08670 [Verrucomicrobiota bacterium]|nr:hypothetical protein [Verrucomicrobiota bacterium]